MGTSARLKLDGITKVYPTVVANDGISLTVDPGSIHAVLGENGAGKSTLMKVIYGVIKPDAGTLAWNGAPVSIASPADAARLGIGMVFQHFSLFPALTVIENILLSMPRGTALSELSDRTRRISRHYGIPVEPDRLVHTLSVGERQRVEIVRNLLQEPQLLILDEPTSVLTPQAIRDLFDMLRKLAAEGCSILYISHKLEEVRELCDTATILRAGRVVATVDPRQESTSMLAQHMIGAAPPRLAKSEADNHHGDRLVVAGLSRPRSSVFGTTLADVELTVRGGEIFGIAGIAGNGQAELLEALSGESVSMPPSTIHIDGVDIGRLGVRARRKRGLVYIPEERLGHGAVPRMSLAKNALLTGHLLGLARHGLIRPAAVDAYARRCIEAYDVKCGGIRADAKTLSGGNLQKFIVGRELLQAPAVVIAAQPTWGLDVGAAAAVRTSLIAMRETGVAILVVSEDLDELFEICDRVAVIAHGRLSPPRPVAETDVEEIGRWMGGTSDWKRAAGDATGSGLAEA